MSALSMSALEAAKAALDAGVHGGQPTRFRSDDIDEYLDNVGMPPGLPWCAAFVFHCFAEAAFQLDVPNTCPKTASALHLWQKTQDANLIGSPRSQLPAPGDVFVLVHLDGIHGHCGFVESCSPGGDQLTTIEGDTNAAGSSTGDAVGRHTWTPGDGKRGRLLGYLAL